MSSNLAPCPGCGRADLARAPTLRWRREPPDVPGWWWHRRTGANADLVYCDVASVEWHASQVARAVARGGAEWAGPIAEPEEGE